jgi:hypothetical protein
MAESREHSSEPAGSIKDYWVLKDCASWSELVS